jgi:hypothetical protein
MTHDYLGNGVTNLFAALNVLDGTLLGRCMQRHRAAGVPALSQRHRAHGPGRQGDPRDPRQLMPHTSTPRRDDVQHTISPGKSGVVGES